MSQVQHILHINITIKITETDCHRQSLMSINKRQFYTINQSDKKGRVNNKNNTNSDVGLSSNPQNINSNSNQEYKNDPSMKSNNQVRENAGTRPSERVYRNLNGAFEGNQIKNVNKPINRINPNIKDLSPPPINSNIERPNQFGFANLKKQESPEQNNYGSLTHQKHSNSNGPSYYLNKKANALKILQKCVVCQMPTEKCCSLCRRVFYCSTQHQQADWHLKHKFVCEGKKAQQAQRIQSENKVIFFSNNPLTNNKQKKIQHEKQLDYQAVQRFLELLEQRLAMRAKILNQVSKLNERTPPIVRQSLVRQAQQLMVLSTKITYEEYKPSFSKKIARGEIMEYSSQQWGSYVIISQTGVGLQYYGDMVLTAKMYHLCGMSKKVRELIISMGKLLEDPQQIRLFLLNEHAQPKRHSNSVNIYNSISTQMFNSINTAPIPATQSKQQQQKLHYSQQSHIQMEGDPLSKTKNLVLQSIIQLSQLYNIDKTTESAYKLFVKKVQIQEGIWEQIYVYFNIGVWYMTKTYYDKSVKSFLYSLQLLQNHKKNMVESAVFKADCYYNVALCSWAINDRDKAIQYMQECYRIRMNSIGKNSMECSNCVYQLAKWYKILEKWNQCLQYMDQCHRIRKLYQNQPGYETKLQQIRILIPQVYSRIKDQKRKNNQNMQPKAQKYFEQLLTKQRQEQQRMLSKKVEEQQVLPKGTVTSRLFREDKQYVKFRIVLSPQFWSTVSSQQAKLLSEIIEVTDQKLQKSEAIRVLLQSKFVGSLTNQQRQQFMKQNQIDKNVTK